jgi:polar amino acid transport system substrate-binding protein
MEATDLWENAVIRQAKERGKLVVAMEPTFRPFEWKDDQDALVGFDVDLARLIGKELGVEVEFLSVVWDSIIPTLVGGQADLIISGMTSTPERALSVSYSDPYFHTVTCLLVSKTKAPDLTAIDAFNAEGRVIAVKEGTTGHFAAQQHCPKARIVAAKTENDAAREVALGRADAFLYDLWSIRKHHRNNPDTTYVIDTPVSREPYAIACRKGDPESVAWLDLVLRKLRLDGRLQELYDKYGLEDVR